MFERELTKVVPQDGTRWAALSVLANVNQFGVAAADLVGSWGSASGASIDHVNIYTGNRAGTAYVSANEQLTFRADGTYTSIYKSASNAGTGSTKFAGITYTGKYKLTAPRTIELTHRFEGRTETFAIGFEAIRGGRILHLTRNGTDLALFRAK